MYEHDRLTVTFDATIDIDIDIDKTDEVSVRVSRNAPLCVRGDVRVTLENGTEFIHDRSIALCRCG